jgi:site-specific DNA-adenine methylase
VGNYLIKFLPSYIGSKSYWVKKLARFEGRNFVELFCGSAVLSANLASSCVLNDLDPFVYKILSRFNQQIVPVPFTADDYFQVRKLPDWWKYAYCLQRLSFSGVFRYSKNGFNVPIKNKNANIDLSEDYTEAVYRWNQLAPTILNRQYFALNDFINSDVVLILDPPYEGAQAAYNETFDFHYYWEYVRMNEDIAKTMVLFDYESNLPFPAMDKRTTRPNGARTKNSEGIFIFEESLKSGDYGERLFLSLNAGKIRKSDTLSVDFIHESGKSIELKSDYYDMTRTDNFFIERWSDLNRKTLGGPWQALKNDAYYYIYFFVKNKQAFIFRTDKLVAFLDRVLVGDIYTLINIPNKKWITAGYKIPRSQLESITMAVIKY